MISKARTSKRALTAFGLALVASLALSALATGSASAATQYWNVCKEGGNGTYLDSVCSEEAIPSGSGGYGLSRLWAGTPTSSVMTGTTGFTLSWTLSGIKVQVNCSQAAEGTVENPVGGGAGAGKFNLTLKNCTVVKPSNCTVGPISMSLNSTATEFGGKPAVKFAPSEGVVLFTLNLQGSKCVFGGTYFEISGSFTGILNSSSLFEFTGASSAMQIGGNAVTLTGTSKMEDASGRRMKVAP
jgi:hypothetical protein